ncbi:MAG TPA: FGGY-family carbohydrate kinase [Ornithinibacter sp.]|nr:FGGY-family carbohydrate kinase [Ornithinibacter sp.]HQA14011.1 FGGY-family carbohydrate kinase [Ornithinibacter sp.]HQD68165.1 FGGY-family carbohydrate kinase [Ornithinibacter sp.]
MTEYVLGIDYGTESCRVAIFDLVGTPIHFAATPYRTTHPRAGWAEQDPRIWWEALQASTHKALAASGVSPAQIVGISYDATTMSVCALDAAGEALRPAIMWMDVRATEQAARAEASDSVARLYNGGGTAPATAEWFPFKAAWLRENEPDTYRAAHRIVDAPDWLTFKLTGEWTVNVNSAALRMYYNRDTGGWPTDFYETVGCGDVFDKIPPRVEDLGTQVGGLSAVAAQLLGLRPGTPVAQGPADAWAGQIGLGVVQPGKLALITGSSHVLTGQTDKAVHGAGFFGAYTDGVVRGQYTVESGQSSTGSVLKWFKDHFARDVAAEADRTGRSVYDLLNERARDVPIGCDGLIVNEYFQGNRTPYTDSKARGMVWGLSLMHGPEHLYRAIQEGICYGAAHNMLAMESAGITVDQVVACGGMTKSRELMQMHADVLGKPITLTQVGDAVALGSAMLAAVGAGVHADLQSAASAMVHDLVTIEPDPSRHDDYAFYLERYMAAYPRLADLTHSLVDHESAK